MPAARYLRLVKSLPALLALALLLPVASCKKDNVTGVPPAFLDVTININLPEYADLQVPGGWVYMTGGSLGLIVYRKSVDEFIAMDRHCPVVPANLCRVIVDESQIIARDTSCCEASFLLTDGSPITVSSFGLTTYHTSFNGTTLRIYN